MYTNINRFEWDQRKAHRNLLKHGIDFNDAAGAFSDPEALFREDWAHSQKEPRRRMIGEALNGRLLMVVFTMRPGPTIRIISVRPAGGKERILYEEKRAIPN